MDEINMFHLVERSLVVGPGLRAGVWVQGCPIHCPGCGNPETLPFIPKTMISTEALAERILQIPGIDGVTFSGGEPFCQPLGLAEVAKKIHAAGKNVVSFSGYTLEQLQNEVPDAQALLKEVDLLIAGPYVRELAGEYLWRGSSNKKLHYLTDRIPPVSVAPPRVQVSISLETGKIAIHGFASKEVKAVVQKAFEV